MVTEIDNRQLNSSPTSQPIKAPYHSLFTKPKTTIQNTYRFFISSFDNENNEFHGMMDTLLSAAPQDLLELRISSPGGLVTECQQIVNVIWNNFKDRNIAFIDSHASSAGAFTFCACDKRVIYKNSRLMLHNYSGGHAGPHQKMKDRMKFDAKHIISFLKSTLKVGKNGFLNEKEFNQMIIGKEFWFDADEMLKRGIATDIVIDGKMLSAEEYFALTKSHKKTKTPKKSSKRQG